jgi:hypothetical protein
VANERGPGNFQIGKHFVLIVVDSDKGEQLWEPMIKWSTSLEIKPTKA